MECCINVHTDGHHSIEYGTGVPQSNTVEKYTIRDCDEEFIRQCEGIKSDELYKLEEILKQFI